MTRVLVSIAIGLLVAFSAAAQAKSVQLLNVSYDPTRELYKAINVAFAAEWKKKTGETVVVNQSHGASGSQARAVIDGLGADIVTLAVSEDVDAIARNARLLPLDWEKRLPDGSSPYTSTIVFVVRKGNPKKIRDWGDLVKPGVSIMTPNPKTSGGARWAYLAAWSYAKHLPGATDATARAYMKALYSRVPVYDSGARAATLSYVRRRIGDVLLAWENEAYLAQTEFGEGAFDIVYPPASILAEPPVALVDKNVDKRGTRAVAEAYLQFLYSKTAQEIEAKNHYRPRDPEIAARYASTFPAIKMYTVERDLGGWHQLQKAHFADGGIFDQISAR